MKETALVTGADGFIGSHLVELLVKDHVKTSLCDCVAVKSATGLVP